MASKCPKTGLLETSVAEDGILNCFQKERPHSAQKSSIWHLWASSSHERWIQPACAFLSLQHPSNELTAVIESIAMKGILGSFLASETGLAHSASAVGGCWQRQAYLSALFQLAGRQTKGLTLRQRSCSLRQAELKAKSAFHF